MAEIGRHRLAQRPDRLQHRRQMLAHVANLQTLHVLGAHGRQDRALALAEGDGATERVGDDQDVGEQDRRIEAIAPQRLQRHFRGEGGRVAKVQEAAGLGPRCPVFGKVAPGLAHQPDGRAGLALSGKDTQERLFTARLGDRHGGPLVLHTPSYTRIFLKKRMWWVVEPCG